MINTQAKFMFAQLADWFEVRAERERQLASTLRGAGRHPDARYAYVRGETWDEAAAHCREAGRTGRIEDWILRSIAEADKQTVG